MVEVEDLCTRVGIVVGGRLRCIGTNQHLKHRFGKGFCLEMKIKHPEEQAIREFCLRHRDAVSHDTLEAACSACGNAARAATDDDPEGTLQQREANHEHGVERVRVELTALRQLLDQVDDAD